MKRWDWLLAAVLTVVALSVVVGLPFVHPELATLQVSQVLKASPRCSPRPTWTPPATVTLRETPKPPTPAPTHTPGPPRIEPPMPVPTLVHPLETEEQVLQRALEVDVHTAEWEDPWCLETPRLQPDRIVVQWYASENAYDGGGRPVEYGGADPVWVVTIKGRVRVLMLCRACNGPIDAGGLVYVINQKTGQIFGTSTLPLR